MNREELLDWLKTYTPMELEFRRFFETYHAQIPEAELRRIIHRYENDSTAVSSAMFSHIDSVVSPKAISPAASHLPKRFSDTLWLYEMENISVRKHPRYFPEIRHSHSFVELAYVLQGNCTQTFFFQDSDEAERVRMEEGMLCIIMPGIEHTISVFDDSIVINILIRTSTMKRALTQLVSGDHVLFEFFNCTLYEDRPQNFIIIDTQKSEPISDLVQGIMIELCEEKQYSQKTAFLMLGLLFTYLQRDHSERIRFSEQASAGVGYIPQVLSYIHYNYRDASVETIAEHFHLSRPYLSRLFKDYTNMTVIQALQKARLDRACEMLIRTQMSVQDIAEKVGYSDVTFFIRVFKKAYRETPLQYRKHHQSHQG